ncbi:hypothetical protein G9A89_016672 [Geosiphon pyriformis]|nr:hypothetical protein G9A89_016672 [Geosiphon pyriformis]
MVITEIKLISIKEKGVFFALRNKWELGWTYWLENVELTMWKGKISVYIVGLYMLASKLPTKKTVAKEIRKLLADIVQNKEIVIVAGDLNEDLASKSLEETIATNKRKKYPTAILLQQMNLVDIYGMYAVNNPNNTWASNGVQRRLNYVFTDVITASLVTNIGVIDVNESFSTDYKAVVTIIRSDRILTDIKKSKTGRKKCSTTMIDVKKAFGTVLQAAECLPKRKVGAQSAHTKKKCMDHKLVKIVTDIIKQIRVNNADMHNNNHKKKYRSTLCARIRLQQQKQIVNNIIKKQQNFELNKEAIIKSILNRKRQKIVLDHVIEEGKFHNDSDDIKKLVNKKAQGFRPIESIPDNAFNGVMAEITIEKFDYTLSHTPCNKASGPSGIQAELWRKFGLNTKSKLRTLLNACIEAADMPEEWRIAQIILIPKPKEWGGNIDITRLITLIESTKKILTKILTARISKTCELHNVLKDYNTSVLKNTSSAVPIYVINAIAKHAREFESNIEAVCGVIGKKHITEKQVIYIFNSVLSPAIEFRSQLTYIPNSWAKRWNSKISATVKKKANLSVDFPASAIHHTSLYKLFKIDDIQAKSKITDLLVRLNSNDIAEMATKIRLTNLQAQRWSAYSILEYPINE